MKSVLVLVILFVGATVSAPQGQAQYQQTRPVYNLPNYESPTFAAVPALASLTSPVISRYQPTQLQNQQAIPQYQPTQQFAQPAIPRYQPTRPPVPPAIRRYQPTEPDQPVISRYQPTQPPAQPAIPQYQPTQPTAQPAIPQYQPTQPTAQPAIPQYQQGIRIAKPYIAILNQSHDHNFDGSFTYSYKTENGISVDVVGFVIPAANNTKEQVMVGTYSYTAPDGTPIETNWYADDKGFHADGAHRPDQNSQGLEDLKNKGFILQEEVEKRNPRVTV